MIIKANGTTYEKYYNTNISNPIKFIKKNANKKTTLIYIDTVGKIKSHSKLNSNKLILSDMSLQKKNYVMN